MKVTPGGFKPYELWKPASPDPVEVMLANVIAVPIVWYLMDRWLTTFAFRIDISLLVFVLAAVITAMIALLTISYQSVSAAITNPVKSLRYE